MTGNKKVRSTQFILVDKARGEKISLHDGFVIGRTAGDRTFPEDMKMSSRHCRFRVIDDSLHIEDLKSTNGTYVNGRELTPLQSYRVELDDKIELGSHRFKLGYEHPTESTIVLDEFTPTERESGLNKKETETQTNTDSEASKSGPKAVKLELAEPAKPPAPAKLERPSERVVPEAPNFAGVKPVINLKDLAQVRGTLNRPHGAASESPSSTQGFDNTPTPRGPGGTQVVRRRRSWGYQLKAFVPLLSVILLAVMAWVWSKTYAKPNATELVRNYVELEARVLDLQKQAEAGKLNSASYQQVAQHEVLPALRKLRERQAELAQEPDVEGKAFGFARESSRMLEESMVQMQRYLQTGDERHRAFANIQKGRSRVYWGEFTRIMGNRMPAGVAPASSTAPHPRPQQPTQKNR